MPVFDDAYWMKQAMLEANKAESMGEVPVGAVLVANNELVATGFNQQISSNDPTAHAEVVALRAAAQIQNNYRLPDLTLYVTLEPCSMCAGAIVHARLAKLVFGTAEPKAGVVCSQHAFFEQDFLNHKVDVQGGVLADACSKQLSDFFAKRREQKRAKKQEGKI